jgi:hypothetical protein
MLFATKTGMGTVLPMICLCFKGRTKMDEAVARFNLRAHPTKRTRLCITLRLLFFTTPCLNSDHHPPQLSISTAAQTDIRTGLGFCDI